MKQRKPLVRATPLRTTTRLERTSRLHSSGPIKAKRRDTGPTKAVRDLVKERARGLCEFCGKHAGEDIHHRRPRALGGSLDVRTNRPTNLVFLARSCHRWLESHREWAREAGWLVRQGVDPASVRLLLPGRAWVVLSDEGSFVVVGEAA